nr:MAG TPA: hypothetical protein [Caudoviricetes sp.]
MSVCVKYHRNIVLSIHFFGIFLEKYPSGDFSRSRSMQGGGLFFRPPPGVLQTTLRWGKAAFQ